jgi:hypothetical protein
MIIIPTPALEKTLKSNLNPKSKKLKLFDYLPKETEKKKKFNRFMSSLKNSFTASQIPILFDSRRNKAIKKKGGGMHKHDNKTNEILSFLRFTSKHFECSKIAAVDYHPRKKSTKGKQQRL